MNMDDHVPGPSNKRMKLDNNDSDQPTCVLSLRGLPHDVTESEVAALAQLHGTVTNIILTRDKHKALVEMSELSEAEAMMDHFSKDPLFVRSRLVDVHYSQHSELRLTVGDEDVSMGMSRCVLHIIIDNMSFPVSLDLLHQIFKAYGDVVKIVTFKRNESFHALVQFSDGAEAHEAKQALNGQNIYSGCCKLFIEFSKLENVAVPYNSDTSRDYLNPSLAWNDPSSAFDLGGLVTRDVSGSGLLLVPDRGLLPLPDRSLLPVPDRGLLPEPDRGLLPVPDRGLLPEPITGFDEAYGPLRLNLPTKALPSKYLPPSNPVLQYTNPFYAPVERVSDSGAADLANASRFPKQVPWSERRPVVLVSNLDEGKVTPDALFTLFSVYGDVIRVKVCCNKKSKALVQYKEFKYAQDAVTFLDGVVLWNRQLKLAISKYRIVQMPQPGAHNAELTKDYMTSRWHRFHKGDRAQAPIVAPSKTLFLANIPPHITETKLRALFNSCATVTDFKFFEPSNLFRLQQAVDISKLPPNRPLAKARILNAVPDARLALIKLSSVEEGVTALMTVHNHQFTGTKRYLCVSFTNSVIERNDDIQ